MREFENFLLLSLISKVYMQWSLMYQRVGDWQATQRRRSHYSERDMERKIIVCWDKDLVSLELRKLNLKWLFFPVEKAESQLYVWAHRWSCAGNVVKPWLNLCRLQCWVCPQYVWWPGWCDALLIFVWTCFYGETAETPNYTISCVTF